MADDGEAGKNPQYLSHYLIDVQDKELECKDSRAYRDGKYHYAIDSYNSFVGVIVIEVINQVWRRRHSKPTRFGFSSNKGDLEKIYQQKCKEGFNGVMLETDFKTLEIPERFKTDSADIRRRLQDDLSKCGVTVDGGDGSIAYVFGEVELDNFTIRDKLYLDCMTIGKSYFDQFTLSLSDLIESQITKSRRFSEITRKDLNGKRLTLKVGKTNVEKSRVWVCERIDRRQPLTWDIGGISSRWKNYYKKEGYKGMVVILVMTEDDMPECLRGIRRWWRGKDTGRIITHEHIILEIEDLLSKKRQIAGCDLDNDEVRHEGRKKKETLFGICFRTIHCL